MLAQLLKQGETDVLEFKTSFGRAVIETLVAFARMKYGNILLRR